MDHVVAARDKYSWMHRRVSYHGPYSRDHHSSHGDTSGNQNGNNGSVPNNYSSNTTRSGGSARGNNNRSSGGEHEHGSDSGSDRGGGSDIGSDTSDHYNGTLNGTLEGEGKGALTSGEGRSEGSTLGEGRSEGSEGPHRGATCTVNPNYEHHFFTESHSPFTPFTVSPKQAMVSRQIAAMQRRRKMGRPEEAAEETVGETVAGEKVKESKAGRTDSIAQSTKGDSSSSRSGRTKMKTKRNKTKTKRNKRNNGFVSNGEPSRQGRSHADDAFMAELARVNAALEAERGERERILHADWALLDVSPTAPLPVDAVPYTGKGGWQTIVSTKKKTDTAKGAKGASEMEAEASGDVGNKDAADTHGRSGNATVDDANTAETAETAESDADSDVDSDAEDGTTDHASLPTLLELDERCRR